SDELAPRIYRRNYMAQCQRHELLAPAAEEWIRADDERVGMQLDEGRESGIDLTLGAGLQDVELHPLHARRFRRVSHIALGIRIVRVHEQGNHPGLRNQLGNQLEPFWRQLDDEAAEAGEVAAWPGETGDQTVCDRVAAVEEDDRDRRGRALLRAPKTSLGAAIRSTLRSPRSAASAARR